MGNDARADAADHDRDREREKQERQQQVAGPRRDGHRADEGSHGADAEVGERDTSHRRSPHPVEEEREHRQGDDLGRDEERERGDRLGEPDRAAVAGREHEPVEHVLLSFGHERATETEQRSEHDRHPEQSARRELRRACRQREVEDDECRYDENEHRRERVARAQLEQ